MEPGFIFFFLCPKHGYTRKIPFITVCNYEKLETAACGMFHQDKNNIEVFFHHVDDECKVGIYPLSYDTREIFTTSNVRNGIFELYVHFRLKTMPPPILFRNRIQRQNNPLPRNPSRRVSETRQSVRHAVSIGDSDLETIGRPDRPGEDEEDSDSDYPDTESAAGNEVAGSTPGNSRRTNRVAARRASKRPVRPQVIFNPDIHGPSLQGLSAKKFKAEHDKIRDDRQRTRPMLRGSGRKRVLNRDTQGRLAHAVMINGWYGIKAPKPCGHCINRGNTCRIYHPDVINLKGAGRFKFGSTCGPCRDYGTQTPCDAGYFPEEQHEE